MTGNITPREPRQYSKYYNTPARRAQCRTNQARYRNRQRDYQAQLEESVGKLRDELDSLKRRRQDLRSLEKSNESPWLVVTKACCFIEKCFQSPWGSEDDEGMPGDKRKLTDMEASFSHDICMGNVCGLDALVQQLRCYAQYFGLPQIRLQRVEMKCPGVITASARLGLTITDLTLRRLFPHISKEPRSKYDTNWGDRLVDRLVSQRLDCTCSLNFLFDDVSGRVVRLETQIGFIPALFQVVRTADAVSEVMEGALISPDCVVIKEEVASELS
ncbi:Bzip transcription factor [Phytophthora megakarya]|uniref:Bzip transcription factor n=1 Tax=Phytophthora megakarya TaxID=4795 RepID=A0A225VGE0_9STRA|nr:Bzip transcription factor [Phytophthora megakarya]